MADNNRCWYHMAQEDERCPNVGTWKTSPALIAASPNERTFLAACVWCDEHKHDDDVSIEKNQIAPKGQEP